MKVIHTSYAQDLSLAVLRGPYKVLEIEPKWTMCKTVTLPAVYSL